MADSVDAFAPRFVVLLVAVLGGASYFFLYAGAQAFVVLSVSAVFVDGPKPCIFQAVDLIHRDAAVPS